VRLLYTYMARNTYNNNNNITLLCILVSIRLFHLLAGCFFYVDTRTTCTMCSIGSVSHWHSHSISSSAFITLVLFCISFFFSFSLSVKGWHFPRSLLYRCWRRRGKEMPQVQEAGGYRYPDIILWRISFHSSTRKSII